LFIPHQLSSTLLDDQDLSQNNNTTLSNDLENFELINLKLDSKHDVSNLDPVSSELLKAQQRLEHLVKKTAPVLNKCKRELEAEHAHWVTTRALNSIDDEVRK
jgi:ribosomal protein L32